ncbi:MAG: DoxX family membrane protein [Planctomycetota bacterium]
MRHALALHLAPLMLRIGLGLTFVWAGAAKLTQQMPVNDQNRAQLAAWGVIEGEPGTPAPDAEDTLPQREEPTQPADEAADPADTLAPEPASEPNPEPESEADDLGQPEPEPADEQAAAAPNASLVAFQDTPTIAELPQTVRRVYGLALLINARANPAPGEDGSSLMPLWPPALAGGKLPVYFAWGAAVTELIAGIAVLFGFFTRLGSLPLAGTMGVAMWLTTVGPAVQTGTATLGFLPPGMFEFNAANQYVYTMVLWQAALLLMSIALVCTGPGFFSIDRLLFGPLEPKAPSYNADDDANVELVPMAGRQGVRSGDDDD